MFHSNDDWLGEPSEVVAQPASLSAVDEQQGLAVAIITRADCSRFRGNFFCSASSCDTKGLAENTAAAFRQQTSRPLCIGVFYDPLESRDFSRTVARNRTESEEEGSPFDEGGSTASKQHELTPEEKSRQHLRLQVQDFLAWREKNG